MALVLLEIELLEGLVSLQVVELNLLLQTSNCEAFTIN